VPGVASKVVAVALQSTGFIGAFMLLPKLQIPVTLGGDAQAPAPAVPTGADPSTKPSTGFQLRCPMDFKAGDAAPDSGPARVTRHAAFWAMGFVGV
jgi:hypothetical protein